MPDDDTATLLDNLNDLPLDQQVERFAELQRLLEARLAESSGA